MDYRWWYGGQDLTRNLLRNALTFGNVKFHEHAGNIWSIRYENRPVFIAHMDTVALCNESNELYIKRGRLRRRNSALGADDRAGVNLIMNHFKKINFIFTRDEEIGRLGAKELAKHEPFLRDLNKVSCIVELDCTGHKKIRGAVHGYCQLDLVEAIRKVVPDIQDTHGSYSDLDSFIALKPGVNLSVGYYKQHSLKEYLVIKEYDYVNSIIPALNSELRGKYKVHVPEEKKYYHWRTKKWETYPPISDFDYEYYQNFNNSQVKQLTEKEQELEEEADLILDLDDEFVCDNCSNETFDLTFVDTLEQFLCPACLLDLYDDLIELKKRGGIVENKINSY